GLADLFIGGAKGSSGQLFLQKKSGGFSVANTAVFDNDQTSEDIGTLFFDVDSDGDLDLYVVSGGNEYEVDSPELQDRLYLNNGSAGFEKSESSLPRMFTSGSCVKASDLDSDGDLDLFVGGRLVPGQYPTTPRSYVLENDGTGHFTDITASINPALEYPGMVTDAIWSDFTGDGKDDLIIVGEFMPIRAFENIDDKLIELKEDAGLLDSQGWWNRIEQGDFDNDGDMDYIVGNFGLNSQLKASPEEPVELYAKDFDNNGSIDPILTSYVMGESYPVFSKDDLLSQLSNLKSKYVNYSDYASAQIDDIFSENELSDVEILRAKTFATSYVENLGNGKFEISQLPSSAQFAPIYGISVEDFNNDGNLDALLAGNFFGTRVKYGRYDANKGLLLLGKGNGKFDTVDALESGLNINGEVRDITVIEQADNSQIILFARNNQAIANYYFNTKNEK
ncbi:MAG: VCBS repeat-containing protein, partial [Pricia sp.]|nr:VCBS repeat-containing protein [Pricia sp.]